MNAAAPSSPATRASASGAALSAMAVLATAVLDRLLYHATVINIRGESYRLKERRKAGLLATPASREKTLNKEAHKNHKRDEPGIIQPAI